MSDERRPPAGQATSETHSHRIAPDDAIRRKVKAELRKRLRGVRAALPLSVVAERSARIVARLLEHRSLLAARTVALFWPIEEKREVDLRALDRALRERGVAVAYPSIDPDSRVMVFRFVADPATLEEAGFGFREPPPSAPEASGLDVVVAPAIGLSPDGHRIGYGAGYYNRALAARKVLAPGAVTIGVAYDFQLLAEVPATEGDVPVDHIVTDARSLVRETAPDHEEPG